MPLEFSGALFDSLRSDTDSYGKPFTQEARMAEVRKAVEDQKMDVNAPDSIMGYSIFHNAIAGGNVEIIRYVAAHGGDLTVNTTQGITALELVNGENAIAIATILLTLLPAGRTLYVHENHNGGQGDYLDMLHQHPDQVHFIGESQ